MLYQTLCIILSHLAPSMRSLHACICDLFDGKPTQDKTMKFSLSDPAKHEATLAYSYVRFQSAAAYPSTQMVHLPRAGRIGLVLRTDLSPMKSAISILGNSCFIPATTLPSFPKPSGFRLNTQAAKPLCQCRFQSREPLHLPVVRRK